MPAKRLPSSARHPPGTGKEQANEVKQTEDSAGAEAADDEVLEIRRWEGEIDAEALNDEMLKLIRTVDAKEGTSEAKQARRCQKRTGRRGGRFRWRRGEGCGGCG